MEKKASEAEAERLANHKTELDGIKTAIEGNDYATGADDTLKKIKADILTWPRVIDTAWGMSSASGTSALEAGATKMLATDDTLKDLAKSLDTAFENSKSASFNTGTELRLLQRLDTLIAQVASSRKTVQDLIVTMHDDELPARWTDPNQSIFVVGTLVEPSLSTGKEVSVSITP